MKMKKLLMLLTVLALAVNMVGCALVPTQPTDTTETNSAKPSESNPVESEGGTETEASSDSMYTNLIETYRTALRENWTPDQLAAKELSQLCLFENGGNGLANVGYAITDVTGEGVAELIVGNLSADTDKVIFDLYTVADGKIIQLCSSSERNRYYLRPLEDSGTACELVNSGSSGAGSSEWTVYAIGLNNPGELTVSQSIKYDLSEDADNPWYMGFWNGNEIVYTTTDEATAKAIINSFEQTRFFPELIPFGE